MAASCATEVISNGETSKLVLGKAFYVGISPNAGRKLRQNESRLDNKKSTHGLDSTDDRLNGSGSEKYIQPVLPRSSFSSTNVATTEISSIPVSLATPRSQLWGSDVSQLISTEEWLRKFGLRANRLDINGILQQIGFRHSDGYDNKMKMPICSRYGTNLFLKYLKSNGNSYNIISHAADLREVETRLMQTISMCKKRMSWLTSESRETFGVILEKSVLLVLDLKPSTQQQFNLYTQVLQSVLQQQVSHIDKFNIIRSGEDPESFSERQMLTSSENIESAIKWIKSQNPETPVTKMSLCEALHKASSATDVDAVYLFLEGSVVDCQELVRGKIRNFKFPVHIVAFNCTSPETLTYLKSLCDISNGRFHAYTVSAELDVYERVPNDDPTKLTSSLVRKKKQYGGTPEGAGVREDVRKLFEELEQAQSILEQLRYLLEDQVLLSKRRQLGSIGETSVKTLEKKTEPKLEPSISSRKWLQYYGLKSNKLDFYDALSAVLFKHADGSLVIHDASDKNQTNVKENAQQKTIHKTVNAKYCNKFATVTGPDGRPMHVHVTREFHRNYAEKLKIMEQRILDRMDWLRKGSREIFGTVVEDQICLLIDTSFSMRSHMEFVKEKIFILMQEQLGQKQKFNIIAFSSQINMWKPSLVDVNKDSLLDAWNWIKTLRCQGTTNVLDALNCALGDPSTQAIYLLTDGRPDQDPDSVILMACNAKKRIPIHTISFNCDDREANEFLFEISKKTDARYHRFSQKDNHAMDRAPQAWQSEDIALLKQELELGRENLAKIERLMIECERARVVVKPPAEPPKYRTTKRFLHRHRTITAKKKSATKITAKVKLDFNQNSATLQEDDFSKNQSAVSKDETFDEPKQSIVKQSYPQIERKQSLENMSSKVEKEENNDIKLNEKISEHLEFKEEEAEDDKAEIEEETEIRTAREEKEPGRNDEYAIPESFESKLKQLVTEAVNQRLSDEINIELVLDKPLPKGALTTDKKSLSRSPSTLSQREERVKSSYEKGAERKVSHKRFTVTSDYSRSHNDTNKLLLEKRKQSSRVWLNKNGLIARNLTLIDVLGPTYVRLGMKYPERLESNPTSIKEISNENFLLGDTKEDRKYLHQIYTSKINLKKYVKDLASSIRDYERRLNLIVWNSISPAERKIYNSRTPVSFLKHRLSLLESLERSGSNIDSDILALEAEIQRGLTYIQIVKTLKPAEKDQVDSNEKHGKTSSSNKSGRESKEEKMRESSGRRKAPSDDKENDNSDDWNDESNRSPSRKFHPKPLQQKNLKVIARNIEDGFYYPGHIVQADGDFASIVRFDCREIEDQTISTNYIIANSGAISRPSLTPSSHVLCCVTNQDRPDILFYVPGIVICQPVRAENGFRFYTAKIFSGKEPTSSRGIDKINIKETHSAPLTYAHSVRLQRQHMILISKERFESAIKYITDVHSIEDNWHRHSTGIQTVEHKQCTHDATIQTESKNTRNSETQKNYMEDEAAQELLRRLKETLKRQNKLREDANYSIEKCNFLKKLSTIDETESEGAVSRRSDSDFESEETDNTILQRLLKLRKTLERLDEGTSVLARFSHDGWYYKGEIVKDFGDNGYNVKDSMGDVEKIWRECILTTVNSEKDSRLNVDDFVIAEHPNHDNSFCPGKIVSVRRKQIHVEFYEGTECDLDSEKVYAINSDLYTYTVNSIREKEMRWMGTAVVAYREATKSFEIGEITHRRSSNEVTVRWSDQTKSTVGPALIFGAFSKRRKISSGSLVLAPCDGKYSAGEVTKINRDGILTVTFYDGTRNSDIDQGECYNLCSQYYEEIIRLVQTSATGASLDDKRKGSNEDLTTSDSDESDSENKRFSGRKKRHDSSDDSL